MIPRETDFTKQESDHSKAFKPSSSTPASTSWSKLKDPRIVRVSKAFGGKDRHSKVCTIRGLRDRRVRLSVPTAIQLYDLQDRLGLSQPSKVVDWLLNAAKHEIDELPPLQIPPGAFQQIMAYQTDKERLKIGGSTVTWNDPSRSSRASIFGGKFRVSDTDGDESVNNWGRNEEDKQLNMENQDHAYNFPSRENLSGLMNNSNPYSSCIRFDPSNLSLSHPPRSHELTPQAQEDWHGFGILPMPVPTGSHHQVLVYQPGMSNQAYFPSQIMAATTAEYDHLKHVNFQGSQLSISSTLALPVNSNAQPVRPIHFMDMTTASLLPSPNNNDGSRKGSIG